MAQFIYSFENGTVGSPYTIDTPANGSTVQMLADNTYPAHGSLGLKVTGADSYQYIQKNLSAAVSDIAIRYYFYSTASATGDADDMRLGSSTAGTGTTNRTLVIRRQGTNRLRIVDGAAATVWTATNALASNTWYRVEIRATCGTAGNAVLTGGYYLGDSTTPVQTFNITNATTTADVLSVRLGKQVTAAWTPSTMDTWFDDLAIDTAPTGLIGPWTAPPNSAPTANAGPPMTGVEPYATVTLDGRGSSDPDADPITYSWTQTLGTAVTLTNPTSSTPSFTAPATLNGSTLRFSLIVSDGALQSSASTVDVTVAAHTIWQITTPGSSPVLAPVRISIQ